MRIRENEGQGEGWTGRRRRWDKENEGHREGGTDRRRDREN